MNSTNTSVRIAPAILLLGCALSCGVLAQTAAYTDTVGYNPSWYLAPSMNGFDPDSDFGTDHRGVGAGVRLGKPLSPAWDIQFGTTYSRSHEGDTQYRQNTLGADALYLFSRSNFRPFVMLGTGFEFDKVNSPTLHAGHTSPYIDAGLGFQYLYNAQWGLQADLRRQHAWLHQDDFGFGHADTNIATVALLYVFDRPASPAPAPRTGPAPVAAVTPPPAAPPAPAPRFERYTLSSTELFNFDSAELRQPQPKLDEIAMVLNNNPQVEKVVITGYTDRIGIDRYNQRLSERRAAAVKDYLVSKGLAADRLNAVGRGESNPVVNCTETKRAALIVCLEPNRRVEVDEFAVQRRAP
ncbi:OmpA family protein [Niveibacterium sp. COAC-50]|uniref:OmpA family protein n=1 Tax=Niveibacterium sp. COAC-50 TaxID=2729384 RepID=UPI001553EEA5|nr:OmpA family protein [Niveibacterium sp. COAC-50]